jgi:4-alpha-glucanotransferase
MTAMLAEPIETTYTDAFGKVRRVTPDVHAAVRAAMVGDREAVAPDAVLVARPGGAVPVAGEVTLEDGTDLGPGDRLPPDVPYGYHTLAGDDGIERLLLVGPGRCHLPPDLRAWGWAVQLATTRSRRSWGIGDLRDLAELGTWTASVGGGFLAVSPLGAPNPGPIPEPSPYYPSTRRFGNPLHLAVEGLATELPSPDALAALDARPAIDRTRVARLKLATLERAWSTGAFDRAAFASWRRERGDEVERWATFCVLTERFGPGWASWPDAYRSPDAPAVALAAADAADRIAFHAWVQWCFDRQLARASASIRRIADLPVGFDPGGFDAWDWQDQLALGARAGAPPDRFNAGGQNWSLPPFDPVALRAARYAPFVATLRATLRHAGGLRIDHVLGLFRLWWIPSGHDASDGAYVRYPTDELLEIVAIESARAGAVVIGEDLGTVPPGVRRELRRRRLLSTRLALFEPKRPDRFPRLALAGVTTHDLPTIAGTWSGADLDDQEAAGIRPDRTGLARLRGRLIRAAGIGPNPGLDELVVGLHASLAGSPAMLVAATLEDALRESRRPNLPGTTAEERPNWSVPLPVPIEDLPGDPRVVSVVRALDRAPS